VADGVALGVVTAAGATATFFWCEPLQAATALRATAATATDLKDTA
jgi:hypothetical protein